jgi:hypothetical protein
MVVLCDSLSREATQRVAHQPLRAHRQNCQKANDLAREAVGCIPPSRRAVTPHQMTGRHSLQIVGIGGLSSPWACSAAGSSFPSVTRMTTPLRHGTTRHNGRLAEPPQARDHAWHHGRSASRAFVPRQHDEHLHDGHWHHARSRSLAPPTSKKGRADHLPQRPNGLVFSCRERAGRCLQKRTISRAKRSAGTPCWAANQDFVVLGDTVGEPRTRATLRFSGRLLSRNRVACVLSQWARSPQPISAKWHGPRVGSTGNLREGRSHEVRQQYLRKR